MERAERSTRLNRSQFLGVAWVGALALLGVQLVVALTRFMRPVSKGGFGGLVYAGKVDEFPVGSISYIMAGRYYLMRNEEGFLAMWQKCTHLGCAVPWVEAENQFHCPCHGSLFDRVGVVTAGPAPRPLDLFPITIRSGEVWVDTSKPTQRAGFEPSQITGA